MVSWEELAGVEERVGGTTVEPAEVNLVVGGPTGVVTTEVACVVERVVGVVATVVVARLVVGVVATVVVARVVVGTTIVVAWVVVGATVVGVDPNVVAVARVVVGVGGGGIVVGTAVVVVGDAVVIVPQKTLSMTLSIACLIREPMTFAFTEAPSSIITKTQGMSMWFSRAPWYSSCRQSKYLSRIILSSQLPPHDEKQ